MRALSLIRVALIASALCLLFPLSAQARPLRVVATISTIASLALPVAGGDAVVTTLVPVGASPEDYQPSPADIVKLREADILVENGAGLEAWLERTIASAKNPALRIVVCTDGLPVRDQNPHLWMDPNFARFYVLKIAGALEAADPHHSVSYANRARAYDKTLVSLLERTNQKIQTIPPPNRTMIVYHNAWEYYTRRFGLNLIGVLETSPGREPSPSQVAHLVDLARRYHVRAVFAEPEYSPKLAQALASSAGIKTVVNLYDDSVGTDPRVADYVGMIDYDTDVIVSALK
ncbi:MAG TPA: metal ABC transporter substrate-binding protein [Candidatus Binatia bacterium]|nr:metal ABC transporter substrate-binding protein [Candidatus Binatia bacterium]